MHLFKFRECYWCKFELKILFWRFLVVFNWKRPIFFIIRYVLAIFYSQTYLQLHNPCLLALRNQEKLNDAEVIEYYLKFPNFFIWVLSTLSRCCPIFEGTVVRTTNVTVACETNILDHRRRLTPLTLVFVLVFYGTLNKILSTYVKLTSITKREQYR